MFPRPILFPFACLLAACTTAPPAPAGVPFDVTGLQADPGFVEADADVAAAKAQIEAFFGRPFAEPVRVTIAADRAAFDAVMPAEWGMTPTQCWMVGVGVADWFAVLSPAAWAGEACEHDGRDAEAVRELIAHELTHSYHGQNNPTRDFTGMDDMGWFVEGLATYVSGQLDGDHASDAAAAIAAGQAPAELEAAWGGKYRYGVSGSMVAFIDDRFGRDALTALLPATSEAELLGRLGLTEAEFLESWKAWVTA
ncbi:MAG: hypothetical protein R3C13_06095 [Hyphomonas sp.]|uniref:hypothetical protein n=1 Tax=Hyphomonas sp. TaxID=87 RepID=UPI0035275CEF